MNPILICDDDESILDSVTAILRGFGWHTRSKTTCNSLEEVVRINPSLILMDLAMPGRGGEEMAKRIKRDPRTKNIPLIIVSAQNRAPEIAVAVGANDCLLKPFDIDSLHHMVRKHISRTPSPT